MSRATTVTGGLLAVISLVAVSCSDNNGTGNGTPGDLGPAAKAKWNEYCAQRTAYMAECLPNAAPCPESMCLAELAEQAPLIEYFDCQLAKSCDMFFNDDDCVVSAGTSDAERDAFIARCMTTLGACAVPEDYCIVGLPLIRKQWMHAFDACLTLPCEDIRACLEAVGVRDCF